MQTHDQLTNEEDEEMEVGSLDPQNLDFVESSIRELGKHLCDISREEQIN